jgi:hypothetical protein
LSYNQGLAGSAVRTRKGFHRGFQFIEEICKKCHFTIVKGKIYVVAADASTKEHLACRSAVSAFVKR